MTYVAVPREQMNTWMHRPYSEMVAAVNEQRDGLVDAYKLAKERRAANDALPKDEQFKPTDACEFNICQGFAIFRDGGRDFRTKDVAALFYQAW